LTADGAVGQAAVRVREVDFTVKLHGNRDMAIMLPGTS